MNEKITLTFGENRKNQKLFQLFLVHFVSIFMVYFSKLQDKNHTLNVFRNRQKNIFLGKNPQFSDELFDFHELKHGFLYSQNDCQNQRNSSKKYIQNPIIFLVLLPRKYENTNRRYTFPLSRKAAE